jgi:hypothetical protein
MPAESRIKYGALVEIDLTATLAVVDLGFDNSPDAWTEDTGWMDPVVQNARDRLFGSISITNFRKMKPPSNGRSSILR